jgi:hypothetical protein
MPDTGVPFSFWFRKEAQEVRSALDQKLSHGAQCGPFRGSRIYFLVIFSAAIVAGGLI